MKKVLILVCSISMCLFQVVKAQDMEIKGTVKDSHGNALALAFVQDKSANTATRSDSLGRFTLNTKPNSKLYVTAAGFKSKAVEIKDKTDIQIILTADKGSDNAAPGQVAGAETDFKEGYGAASGMLYTSGVSSGLVPVFKYTEATQGNRYLFKDWVGGYVVSPEDSVYKNPNYGFNYDKISGALLLSQDKHNAIEIDQARIKSFTLYDELNRPNLFEYVPEINKTHYPLVLASGNKYKIYKLTITTFIKNNYQTDGMTSHGNNYDEYADDDTYYVQDVKTKQLHTFKLKKKSIKGAFGADADKVNSFFESNDDKINDAFLIKLGAYVNQ